MTGTSSQGIHRHSELHPIGIVLAAPCVRPGVDGVGDYALGVGRELVRSGCRVFCIGLGDFHDGGASFRDSIAGVDVLNLAAGEAVGLRMRLLRDEIARFAPDLVAVQYYWRGFRSGGGHAELARALRSGSGDAVRMLMFHEALHEVAPRGVVKGAARTVLIGASIALLGHAFAPDLSATTCLPNAHALGRFGVRAECLPVPPNIARADVCDPVHAPALERIRNSLAGSDDSEAYSCLTFGRLPPGLPVGRIIEALEHLRRSHAPSRPGVLVSIGRSAYGDVGWNALRDSAINRGWRCVKTGSLPESEVSLWIQSADIGFVPTPKAYLDKSGVHAAFTEHGLPMLVVDDVAQQEPRIHLPAKAPESFASIAARLREVALSRKRFRAV